MLPFTVVVNVPRMIGPAIFLIGTRSRSVKRAATVTNRQVDDLRAHQCASLCGLCGIPMRTIYCPGMCCFIGSRELLRNLKKDLKKEPEKCANDLETAEK